MTRVHVQTDALNIFRMEAIAQTTSTRASNKTAKTLLTFIAHFR